MAGNSQKFARIKLGIKLISDSVDLTHKSKKGGKMKIFSNELVARREEFVLFV